MKKTTKPPPTRRRFRTEWDEIEYLYQKILYWFYPVRDRRKTLKYCDRMEALLKKVAANHETILGEECWSLVCEARGDLARAIAYRENEIRLIHRLHEISLETPTWEVVSRGYEY